MTSIPVEISLHEQKTDCGGHFINSIGNEYSPVISPDRKYFFWTSARGFADTPLEKRLDYQELTNKLRSPRNGLRDIYQIDLSVLTKKLRPASGCQRFKANSWKSLKT